MAGLKGKILRRPPVLLNRMQRSNHKMSKGKFVNFASWFLLMSMILQWPVIVEGISSATIVQS
jgi:hypothetical protein